MGIYFNPDNEGFAQIINSPIYIDKTGLINFTNESLRTEGKCIALSHARRFGKSQAAKMLKAFYSRGCDSKSLFEKFEIAQSPGWDRYLNKFNVIHLDMMTFSGNHKEDLLEHVIFRVSEELKNEYPFIPKTNAGWRPAMIVELKWDKSADAAIKQIKEKRYASKILKNHANHLLLVAINYDKKTKNHTCIIEEYEE